MKSGIYAIYNKKSGKVYIGQTKDLDRRKQDHFRSLQKGKHHNKYLQRAYNTDGAENFFFVILERCPIDLLDERERHYIGRFQTEDAGLGYNLEGGGNVGKEVSERVREAKRGAKNPMYGKPLSESHIQALKIKNRCHGSKLTETQVAEIKELLALQKMTSPQIADRFGVSTAVICKIKTGKNFEWVRPDLNEIISEKRQKEDRNAEILRLTESGMSRSKISKRLGICPGTVQRVLGYDAERKKKLRDDVNEDFARGMTKAEILEKYKITSSVYVKITHDAFVKRRHDKIEMAIELRKSGMMVKDIAKLLNVSRLTVSKWTFKSC